MKNRTRALPLLVVVAVVALVVGSFGTATAAGLTKAKVKKIATKVVNKKAPTLSVASAANAGNATNLNGQPASAYQNSSYRFRLPVQAAAAEKVFSFPGLPAGRYLFTYNVVVLGGGAGMFCHMRPTSANTNGEGFQYSASGAGTTISASGIIETTATSNLRGTGGANFTVYGGADVTSSVTFTRIDSLTAGTTAAPGAVGGTAATSPLTR